MDREKRHWWTGLALIAVIFLGMGACGYEMTRYADERDAKQMKERYNLECYSPNKKWMNVVHLPSNEYGKEKFVLEDGSTLILPSGYYHVRCLATKIK